MTFGLRESRRRKDDGEGGEGGEGDATHGAFGRGAPTIRPTRTSGESDLSVLLASVGRVAHLATGPISPSMTSTGQDDRLVVPQLVADVLERMTDGFVALDRTFHYVYVNERGGEMLGRPARQLIGKHIWTEFPEGIGQPFHLAYERVLASGVAETIEAHYAPWDRWFENRIYPTINGIGILFTEITERKHAMMWAEGQRRVLSMLATGAPLHDVLGEIVGAVEEQCTSSIGSIQLMDARGNMLYLVAGPHLHPEMRAILESGIPVGNRGGTCGSAAHTGQVQVTPNVFEDPRWEPYRDAARQFGIHGCWSAPIFDRDGKVLGTIAQYSSTHCDPGIRERGVVDSACQLAAVAIERRHADEALFLRERELATLAEHTPDVVLRLDRQHRFVFANPAMEAMTRIAARDLIGHGLEALPVDQWPRATWEEALTRAFAEGEPVEITLEANLPGGRRVLDARLAPEQDGAGEVEAVIMVIRDVTRQRALEERLRQGQKIEAIGRLAGGVAHDFNNLLTAIGGFAGLVRDSLEAGHPASADIDELEAAVTRAAELTRQLLAFSRQQVLSPKVVDVDAIAGRLEPILRQLLPANIEFSLLPSGAPATVRADPTQLEQVFLNLVVNARDAMPAGGTLQVDITRLSLDEQRVATGSVILPGEWVVLSVSDSGGGMNEETRGRIFEPFFTTKAPGQGTGLGLAMVYGVVQQSDGHVLVESDEGRGTTFRVYLPRVAEAPTSLSTPVSLPSTTTATADILIVDDESSIRALARRILERHGYVVREAKNGADALRLMEETSTPVDLLLSDVVMPGMDGRELARRFTQSSPTTRVLLMSGYSEIGEDARAGVGPIEDEAFLEKPFTAQQLLDAVRKAIAHIA
jgi:PAS domain S-box-containing protein